MTHAIDHAQQRFEQGICEMTLKHLVSGVRNDGRYRFPCDVNEFIR
jgi:hypothetical protein